MLANVLQNVEPVHVGQAEIEYYNIRRFDIDDMQGRFALGNVIRNKALVTEGFAQSTGKRLVVFDEKNLHAL